MDALAHLLDLDYANLYRQAPGIHPTGALIPDGLERIELVTTGRGWVEVADRWEEVTPGSLVWNIAGDRTIGRSDFTNPYHCLATSFRVRSGGPRRVARLTRWDDPADVNAFSERVLRLFVLDAVDRATLAAWAYARLLLQARLWEAHASAPALPEPLRRVTDAINGRYAHDLDIDTLAREAGWSPTHLHAMFRRHLGVSPHQYLVRRRVRAACALLASTGHSLAEIATSTGMATPQVLCRAFRRQMGMTPAAYRRQPTQG